MRISRSFTHARTSARAAARVCARTSHAARRTHVPPRSGTIFALMCMWMGISLPLTMVGSYFGYKGKVHSRALTLSSSHYRPITLPTTTTLPLPLNLYTLPPYHYHPAL